MTIRGCIYSRGATIGTEVVKAYTFDQSKTVANIASNDANLIYRDDEGGRNFVDILVGTGNTVLVSGVENKSIEVTDLLLVASGATVVKFLSDTTVIGGPMSVAANDTIGGAGQLYKTGKGEDFVINLTASSVGGNLSYRLV